MADTYHDKFVRITYRIYPCCNGLHEIEETVLVTYLDYQDCPEVDKWKDIPEEEQIEIK